MYVNAGNFLAPEDLLASQEELCTVELEVSYATREVFPVLITKANKGIGGIALLTLHLSTV
jgi:hypothetical protein